MCSITMSTMLKMKKPVGSAVQPSCFVIASLSWLLRRRSDEGEEEEEEEEEERAEMEEGAGNRRVEVEQEFEPTERARTLSGELSARAANWRRRQTAKTASRQAAAWTLGRAPQQPPASRRAPPS